MQRDKEETTRQAIRTTLPKLQHDYKHWALAVRGSFEPFERRLTLRTQRTATSWHQNSPDFWERKVETNTSEVGFKKLSPNRKKGLAMNIGLDNERWFGYKHWFGYEH